MIKSYTIFSSTIEQAALDQFYDALEQPFAVTGALMPDAHMGYSLPIGAVVATDGVIVPAWVGYDIGCGMCAVPTAFKKDDVSSNAEKIFNGIYRDVPVGFKHNSKDSVWSWDKHINSTDVLDQIFMERGGLKQLGTLGGGNHFIEIGCDEEDVVWIIIHSGSRNLGHQIATHYMKLASGDGKAREGHFGFSVDSLEGKRYLTDMNFCLEFALENRKQLVQRVVNVIREVLCDGIVFWGDLINRNHNHAEEKNGLWIHRKGATHAEEGMMGVIPGNMRDGSFIVEGKGNQSSLWSSSHGAGRVMGRKEAERQLNVTDFARSMSGIWATVNQTTLDESPLAYKNIFEVMELQKDLVKVVHHIKPLINIKG